MPLVEEYDDPFDAAIHAFELFGFDEIAILESDIPAAQASDTAREALIAHFQEGWGYPETDPDFDTAWANIEHWFLIAFPTSLGADYKVHAHKIPKRLTLVLDQWGYDVDVTLPAQPDARYPSLSGEHPEVFIVTVTDTETNETVAEQALRLYPHATETLAVQDHTAAAELCNETVLAELGLEIVGRREPLGDDTPLLLAESERLDALESEYGPEIPLFHDEEPLIYRPLQEYSGFDDYEPDNAIDHKQAFGVPEPTDTFRLETAEATRTYFE
ncbi:hypothetical protein [Halococcoides cellulosivorans]|uniref:Uncharacterized protein n=1 Tax=Halococcoides cellulosivorans TaxID=1679096 RepID=A0A2R4X3Q3_9EURY|nr:hypothetical protein [Halococcoides cellulosivorans]AWB28426.1 hypothetical protein HARCEL1_12310 [Halococcoides cellulosivorans]